MPAQYVTGRVRQWVVAQYERAIFHLFASRFDV